MAIIIDDKIIETPIKDILIELQQYLKMRRIDKLHDMFFKGVNARITCPIHKGGHEQTPSCDVLLQDRHGVGEGVVHCFSCGYRANLLKFIRDCINCSYAEAKEWLFSVARFSYVEASRELPDVFESSSDNLYKNNYDELPKVTDDELKSYNVIHPYMYRRHLTDETIKKFEIGYDSATKSITFPVYVDGRCLFVARRRVDYKRFDLPKVTPKPIYGLDYITDDTIYVTESVFNALSLWQVGKQAVALFGLGSEEQAIQLQNLPQRKIILALDGDKPGDSGCRRLCKYLTNKIVTRLDVPRDGRDINDLSDDEINNLEELIV